MRVRKVLVNLHCTCNSKSTVIFSCTLALSLVDELLRQRGAVHERDELVGPRPAQPMPRGALRRLDRLAYGGRWIVDLPGGHLRSIRTSKVSSKSIFLFCGKCAICDFPSETGATPLPPFRNALRLEKNCELMRCSLRYRSSRKTSKEKRPLCSCWTELLKHTLAARKSVAYTNA